MRRRGWVATLVSLVVVGAAATVASVRLHRAISAEKLEERLYRALARSTDSLYRVHIDETHSGLLKGRWAAKRVTITASMPTLISIERRRPHRPVTLPRCRAGSG
jgi:hypothetical protein